MLEATARALAQRIDQRDTQEPWDAASLELSGSAVCAALIRYDKWEMSHNTFVAAWRVDWALTSESQAGRMPLAGVSGNILRELDHGQALMVLTDAPRVCTSRL